MKSVRKDKQAQQLGESRQRKRLQLLPLLAVLLVAAAVRLYGLDRESLWNDELSSWARSSYPTLSAVIDEGVRPDVHPPGWQILLFVIEKLIGDSEFILRLPSAITGVLTVLAVYLVGRELYCRMEGLLAAAFTAVLWFPVAYSQEARAYSTLMFTSTLAIWLWIRIMRQLWQTGRLPRGAAVGFAVCSIVSAYLHYFGLYFVLLEMLASAAIFIRRPRELGRIMLVFVAVLAAYGPWWPQVMRHLQHSQSYIRRPQIDAPVEYMKSLFDQSGSQLHDHGLVVAGVFCFYAYLFVMWSLKKVDVKQDWGLPFSPGLFLICWLCVPYAGAFIKSVLSTPVLTNKNLVACAPAAYLLLARAFALLPLAAFWRYAAGIGATGLFLFGLVFGLGYYTTTQKEQYREAVKYVIEEDRGKDSLIIGCANNIIYYNYYFRRMGYSKHVIAPFCTRADVTNVQQIINERNPEYVWLLVFSVMPEKPVMKALESKLELLARKSFFGGGVMLYKVPKD